MAKKYLTPDFDVTAFEVKDIISADIVTGDPDEDFGGSMSFTGDGWEV